MGNNMVRNRRQHTVDGMDADACDAVTRSDGHTASHEASVRRKDMPRIFWQISLNSIVNANATGSLTFAPFA